MNYVRSHDFLNGRTYHTGVSQVQGDESGDYSLASKKQVVLFVQEWSRTVGDAFWEDDDVHVFLEVNVNFRICS